jgi:hypothetical protein
MLYQLTQMEYDELTRNRAVLLEECRAAAHTELQTVKNNLCVALSRIFRKHNIASGYTPWDGPIFTLLRGLKQAMAECNIPLLDTNHLEGVK